MKYLGLTFAFCFFAIFFGIQAPRAATSDGQILLVATATMNLVIALYFVGRYEETRRPKPEPLTKAVNMYLVSGHGMPSEPGRYIVRWKEYGGENELEDIMRLTDGGFAGIPDRRIIAWAGPLTEV